MNKTHIVIIPGDGIGPEITDAVIEILEAARTNLEWVVCQAGIPALKEHQDLLPKQTIDEIRKHKIALKAPLTTPIGTGFRSINVSLRTELELYANLRPVKSLPGIMTPFENIDFVIVRENTEGLYAGIEHTLTKDIACSIKLCTREASKRIAKFAFEYALKNNRKKVTGVHKANIMKLSDGLALEAYREIAKDYPKIIYDEKIVDATAMLLVTKPTQFDVILAENLYGDILSDLAAGLIGGLGVAPGVNIGANGISIFEAVHGSAPDIAGQGIANPTALLRSAIEMLYHIDKSKEARNISQALCKVLSDTKIRTSDLGGTATTNEFKEEIIKNLNG